MVHHPQNDDPRRRVRSEILHDGAGDFDDFEGSITERHNERLNFLDERFQVLVYLVLVLVEIVFELLKRVLKSKPHEEAVAYRADAQPYRLPLICKFAALFRELVWIEPVVLIDAA